MSDQSSTTIQDMETWAEQLLSEGNLPTSVSNEEVITGMEYQEGGPTQDQSGGPTNPLDVENPIGSGEYNPYGTTDEGIQSTLQTLQSNDPTLYAALQSSTGDNPAADISGLSQGTWEGYSPAANESYAGSVSGDIADVFGGQSPTVTTASGGVTAPKAGKYDFFTQGMIQLNGVMHPKVSATTLLTLGTSAIGPEFVNILARGAFALGFGAVGFYALFKAASGGKISGADLPALVAGFIAGPEIGAATALSKLGIKKPAAASAGATGPSPTNVISQQRLAFQQQTAQQKLQLAAAKNASQAQLGQQRLAASQASQTQRTQTAHKKTLAQRYAARQRVAAAQVRAQPRTSTIHHATTRQSTITHYSAKNPPPQEP